MSASHRIALAVHACRGRDQAVRRRRGHRSSFEATSAAFQVAAVTSFSRARPALKLFEVCLNPHVADAEVLRILWITSIVSYV